MKAEAHNEFSASEQQHLLRLARAAIAQHWQQAPAPQIDAADFTPHLTAKRACFVTLTLGTRLRGCIGGLQATRALVEEVALRAEEAAFHDPRFEPLEPHELDQLTLHIAVLDPLQPLPCRDRSDLIDQLRPGIDGLLIADGDARATFLPAVWQTLPDKHVFVSQLLLKAGLPADHWSSTLRIHRFTCSSFSE